MKISTESIQGFEGMSPEEKVTALLDLDLPDPQDLSGYVKKEEFEAKKKEADKLAKELRGKMSAEENAKANADEAMQKLQSDYNELLRRSTIAGHTANYLTLPGYDKDLARETAEALFDGDMEKVFQNQQKANAVYEKAIKAGMVKEEGRLPGAGGKAPEEDQAVALAKKLGEKRAQSRKREGLDRYII